MRDTRGDRQILPTLRQTVRRITSIRRVINRCYNQLRTVNHRVRRVRRLGHNLGIRATGRRQLLLRLSDLVKHLDLPRRSLLILRRTIFASLSRLRTVRTTTMGLRTGANVHFRSKVNKVITIERHVRFFTNIRYHLIRHLTSFFISAFARRMDRAYVLGRHFVHRLRKRRY